MAPSLARRQKLLSILQILRESGINHARSVRLRWIRERFAPVRLENILSTRKGARAGVLFTSGADALAYRIHIGHTFAHFYFGEGLGRANITRTWPVEINI